MPQNPQDHVAPVPAPNFRPIMPSPTTLPAEVVAETFDFHMQRGMWYSSPEIPMDFCDSPVARFCTGHCRKTQWSDRPSEADVVCFFFLIFCIYTTDGLCCLAFLDMFVIGQGLSTGLARCPRSRVFDSGKYRLISFFTRATYLGPVGINSISKSVYLKFVI